MHDLDRTQRELEAESHEQEHEQEHENEAFLGSLFGEAEQEQEAFLGSLFGEAEAEAEQEHEHEYEAEAEAEAEAEYEQEHEHEAESPLSETQELELASELLEVSNEAELEQFLGGLFKKAARGVSNFARSSTGRALGGVLKGFAKRALPVAGTALGTYLGGPIGAKIGGGLGQVASGLFELELEGLTHEDREFEVARQFVRLGAAAAKSASRMPRVAPKHAARRAFVSAAKTYAPGALRRAGLPASRGRGRGRVGCKVCAARRRGLPTTAKAIRRPKAQVVTRSDGTRFVRRPRPPAYYYGGGQGGAYGGAVAPSPVDVEPNGYFDAAEPAPSARRTGRWFWRDGQIVLVGL